MINRKINKHDVKIYDSIEELPIVNFQKYNKFMLISSIIGNDVADIDLYLVKAIKYIEQNDLSLAVRQIENIRNALYLINQELSPKYLAFAALVAEIDGKAVTDLSDSNLKEVLSLLNTERKSVIDNILTLFKKKVDNEFSIYFPKFQNSAQTKELYTKLKNRVLLELDTIISDSPDLETIDKIDTELLLTSKPKVFSGPESFEVQNDKQFNELCLFISKSLNVEVKKLTVFEFYNSLEYIEKETKIKK